MSVSRDVPTLADFQTTARHAFAFLARFGFAETSTPPHRAHNPFQVWFRADRRFVIVRGEGYGTMARVHLETADGLELEEIYLAPSEAIPKHSRQHRSTLGQLQQIHEAAQRLELYSVDFLSGDEQRFLKLARPLPPYLRPPA
jgi:hypothetical protein